MYKGVYKRSPQKISVRDLKSYISAGCLLFTGSLYKIPMRGLPASPGNLSVQALYKVSLGKIHARELWARSLQQIFITLCNVSVQDLRMRCPGKISAQALYKRSLGTISSRDLCRSCLRALSWQDLCKGPLGKISVQDL